MLSPEKIGFSILYLLSEIGDERTTSAEGLAEMLDGQCTKDFVQAQLVRLGELGLARDDGAMPIMVNDYTLIGEGYWKVTHDGTVVIRDLARSKRTFVGRLVKNGLDWLKEPEAERAKLSAKLDKNQVHESVSRERAGKQNTTKTLWFFDVGSGFYHTTVFIAALVAIVVGYFTLKNFGVV